MTADNKITLALALIDQILSHTEAPHMTASEWHEALEQVEAILLGD